MYYSDCGGQAVFHWYFSTVYSSAIYTLRVVCAFILAFSRFDWWRHILFYIIAISNAAELSPAGTLCHIIRSNITNDIGITAVIFSRTSSFLDGL
ncbi:hypothetical protein D3C78_1644710 [compost metagenome]